MEVEVGRRDGYVQCFLHPRRSGETLALVMGSSKDESISLTNRWGAAGAPTAIPPTLIHPLAPHVLLVGTDAAALHVYDVRAPTAFDLSPQQTFRPHADYVSSLAPLPGLDGAGGVPRQWVTTGGTTLAVTDLRKGVLATSEEQDDDLLCGVFLGGRKGRARARGDGGGRASGVLTLWERGAWEDQSERIVISKGDVGGFAESVDAVGVIPEGTGSERRCCGGHGRRGAWRWLG